MRDAAPSKLYRALQRYGDSNFLANVYNILAHSCILSLGISSRINDLVQDAAVT
jgi:hypothetical protein